MNEHNAFYYPYANFNDAQLPLLKVAALWFDRLVILDPSGASWDGIGTDAPARDAVRKLKDAGILKLVAPADVLNQFETPITEAIRRDMRNEKFLELCDQHSRATGKQRWTLSLAKVPQDVLADQTMRHVLGDFARDVAHKAAYATNDYIENIEALSYLPGSTAAVPLGVRQRAHNLSEYAETGQSYDEYVEGNDGSGIEYRYADFPLPLGEAIMMNHALFAGLLHAGATPITDNAFHSSALALKLSEAADVPEVQQARAARARELKTDLLAVSTLTDAQLNLPVLDPSIPLDEVLEYRRQNESALRQARDKLGWIARRIQAEPWTKEFADELEHKTIPDIAVELEETRKARDGWLKSQRGRLALSAGSILLGAAGTVLSLFAAPLMPIGILAAGLTLSGGAALPGVQWALDLRAAKPSAQENGLHYLLTTR